MPNPVVQQRNIDNNMNNHNHNSGYELSNRDDTSTISYDNDSDTDSTASTIEIHVSEHDKQQCNIYNWYKQHRKHTIKTKFITLNNIIIDYILTDSVYIPNNILTLKHDIDSDNDIDIDSDDRQIIDLSDNDDSNDNITDNIHISQFAAEIDNLINELNGQVYIQLNYNTPSDAVWITTEKSLKCKSAGDVLLLLKSSDKIADELHNYKHQFHNNVGNDENNNNTNNTVQLVLRKWSELHRSRIVRCFVKNKQLIAISQVDTEYHSYLNDNDLQQQWIDLIYDFYNDKIKSVYDCNDYIFDTYIDTSNRVWLIKMKLWSHNTNTCLFTWNELVDYDTTKHTDIYDIEFRVVESNGQAYYDVSMRHTAKHVISRLPHIDSIDVSDTAAIERFAQMQLQGLI